MTYTVPPVDINADNWGDAINKLNLLIDGAANNFVTIGADPNNGNLDINGGLNADSVTTIAVTTNTAIANSATIRTITGNTANVTSIQANSVTTATANVNTLTVATGNVNNLVSNTISAANVAISNTATVNRLVANTLDLTTANVANVTANNLTVNAANVVTTTSNTVNVNRLNANTANVNSIFVSTRLELTVNNFTLYGGTGTAKFLTTNGAGVLKFYYPQLADISDFAAYSANVANTITQLESNTNSKIAQSEANALAFAVALG